MSSLLGVSASERIPELDHTLALGGVGQASTASAQIVATERTVRDNADSAVGRKRQYPLLRVAHIDRVRQLYEVDWLALDDGRKLGKRGRCVVRNPDVS